MTPNKRKTWLFWVLLLGLIAFVVAVGTPFLSAYASGKVVSLFGCSPAALDGPAVCPEGSIATRFTPLTHWIGSVMAPVLFVKQFWDVIIGWVVLITVVAFPATRTSRANNEIEA